MGLGPKSLESCNFLCCDSPYNLSLLYRSRPWHGPRFNRRAAFFHTLPNCRGLEGEALVVPRPIALKAAASTTRLTASCGVSWAAQTVTVPKKNPCCTVAVDLSLFFLSFLNYREPTKAYYRTISLNTSVFREHSHVVQERPSCGNNRKKTHQRQGKSSGAAAHWSDPVFLSPHCR